jgi:flagellin
VQVDSLQIAGTVETGDSYAVTINGENISYTVAAADTSISDVRAGLVSAINSSGAAENLTASLNDDGSISLTGLAAGVGFTASASVADVGRSRDTIASIDVSTSDGAVAAMAVIEAAIEQIGATRSELGAISNRLDHTITNLTNVAINTSAAMGRIMDADFAAESTQLAKSQILQQASMAMLAQANASKQGVLSLLQG